MSEVLRCAGLAKRFGSIEAVRDVSFSIGPGETYGLLGPNGAGKTTTISLVCGLLEADRGEVVVAGVPMTPRGTKARAAIGYVPQDVAVYPDLTARENLRFFGRLQGLRGAALDQRVAEVLDVVALADRADDRTEEFSGGMKRRLNIAVGLLHEPALLLLDEPTVGVDPQSRNAILDAVAELGREGMAVLYTTHYMEEAERLCDRVGIIDHGELRAEGTRRELVALVGGRDKVTIEVGAEADAVADALRGAEGVESVSATDGQVEVLVVEARRRLADLLGTVGAAGATVSAVEVDEPDLEAVFLHLTGRTLRD